MKKLILPLILVLVIMLGASAWYVLLAPSSKPQERSDQTLPVSRRSSEPPASVVEPAPPSKPVPSSTNLDVPVEGPSVERSPRPPEPPGVVPDDVSAPPGIRLRQINAADLPDPMDAQIYRTVERYLDEEASVAEDVGRRLLTATNELLRMTGYALLDRAERLTRDDLLAAAQDPDMEVPLMLAEWMQDHGQEQTMVYLMGALEDRGLDAASLLSMIDENRLQVGGGRLALDFLEMNLPAAEVGQALLDLAGKPFQPYALRMKAAIMLQQHLDLGSYMQALDGLQSGAEDILLREGFKRQQERARVPAALADRVQVVLKQDIASLVSRAYPMMLEDMATYLEEKINRTANIQPGTAEQLLAYMQERYKDPMAPAEKASMVRLETLLPRLQAAEASADLSAFKIHEGPAAY